jgi:hypothetical protein
MKVDHVRGCRFPFCGLPALAALAVLLGLTSSAIAREVGRSEFDAFNAMRAASGGQRMQMGGGGLPIPTTPSGGGVPIGNMSFKAPSGGWPGASGTGQLPTPIPGKSLPVSATQKFNRAAMARAVGRFAMKLAVPLTVGMATYELINDLLIQTEFNEEQKENRFYRTNWGKEYSVDGVRWRSTQQSACQDFTFSGYTTVFYPPGSKPQYGGPDGTCARIRQSDGVEDAALNLYSRPGIDVKTYLDEEQLMSELNAAPNNEAMPQAVAEAINSGEKIETEGDLEVQPQLQKIEGPTKTQASSTGESLSEKTECDVAVVNGVVDYICKTVTTKTTPAGSTTVVVTNPDGTTSTQTVSTPSTTTTQTTTSSEPERDKDEFDVPDGEIPRAEKSVSFSPMSILTGNGTCPQDKVFTVAGKSHTMSYAQICTTFSNVRPLIIAIAFFMAYVIVLPGAGGKQV